MANLTSQLLVRLIDGVSGPARGAAAALRQLNGAARGGAGGGAIVALQDRVSKAAERNRQAVAAMQGRLLGVGAAGYALHRAFRPVIGSAADFETVMEDLGQKADMSGDRLKGVGKRIKEIGKQTNQGALDAARGVDFLVGMGLGGKTDAENVENALKMAPAIGKASTAFRAQFEDIAKASHAVFFNLQTPAEQVLSALDAMAEAGQQGGFELKDMAATFPGLTASAQFLGMKGVGAVADLAAALQIARTGAQDGAQAANNMANFFQKLTLKETVKNFKKFGVDVYKELKFAREKGISPIEHMMNVLKKTTGGNEDLISQIFGDKQVLEFIRPMWKNMERYKKIRADAMSAQGLTEKQFARRMETFQAKANSFAISLENMRIAIGNALLPGLADLMQAFAPVVRAIEQFAEANPELTATIVALTAGAVALGAAVLAIGIAAGMARGGLLAVAGGALKLAKPLSFLAGGVASRVLGFFQTLRLRSKLGRGGGKGGIFGHLVDGIMVLARSAGRLLKPSNIIRGLFAMGPKGWALAGALTAITAAVKHWDKVKAFGGGFWTSFTENLKPLDGVLRPVGEAFERLGKAFNDLLPSAGSADQWRSWGEALGSVAAGGVNTLVSAIEKIVATFAWVIEKANAAATAVSNFFSSGRGGAAGNPAAEGGAFGSSVAPEHRSRGGRVTKGRSYIVGERRQELFTPGQSGYIMPRVPPGGGGGGGASAPVTVNITVDGAGDPRAVADEVKRQLERVSNDLFRGVQADARTGFGY